MKKVILFLLASLCLIVACNSEKKDESTEKKETMPAGNKDVMSSTGSKQERNKKVAMASMEAFNKGDLDGTFKDAASSFVDLNDGSIPPITSLDTLKGFMKMLTTSLEGYHGESLKYYADGDYVLVHGDWSGVFKKDFMGIKASGKPVKFKDVDIFKFNDEGKVVEHAAVQNPGGVLATSGMMK